VSAAEDSLFCAVDMDTLSLLLLFFALELHSQGLKISKLYVWNDYDGDLETECVGKALHNMYLQTVTQLTSAIGQETRFTVLCSVFIFNLFHTRFINVQCVYVYCMFPSVFMFFRFLRFLFFCPCVFFCVLCTVFLSWLQFVRNKLYIFRTDGDDDCELMCCVDVGRKEKPRLEL